MATRIAVVTQAAVNRNGFKLLVNNIVADRAYKSPAERLEQKG